LTDSDVENNTSSDGNHHNIINTQIVSLQMDKLKWHRISFMVMEFNTLFNFNNISVISWRSILLVEETRVPGENHWPATNNW